MSKRLKSLESANQERRAFYKKMTEPGPNGIACPKCGDQLWDTNPTMELMSSPPQKDVHCPGCSYTGTRIA